MKIQDGRQDGRQKDHWENISRWEHNKLEIDPLGLPKNIG